MKRHFVERRRNDAVARFRDLGERSRHLVVCALGFYEIAERRHKVEFVIDIYAALLFERAVEQPFLLFGAVYRSPFVELDDAKLQPVEKLAFRLFLRAALFVAIAHFAHAVSKRAGAAYELGGDGIALVERSYPPRRLDIHVAKREFVQHRFKQLDNVVLTELGNVHRDDGIAVFVRERLRELDRFRRLGHSRVKQYDKRFAERFQLVYRALFRLDVRLARQIGLDRAVARHDNADSRVLGYHLFRAYLRGAFKRHGVVAPRRLNHARAAVFGMTVRAVDHIADAVDEPHRDLGLVAERDLRRLARNELWLGRHYGLALRTLRQLVAHALQLVAGDGRYNKRIHKIGYERRFARTHRPDNAYVYIAARPLGYVLVNVVFFHDTSRRCVGPA